MAENETAVAATATTSTAEAAVPLPDNSSSESATSAPPPPVKPETKRWADLEDDPPEELDKTDAPSTSEPDVDVDVSELKITENKFLDDPEDSNISAVTDTPYTSASSFEDLNLSAEVLKGLYVEMEFKKPSKIQAITLPMILTPPHKDLIAQAHNGSGKTTCFVLGMLSRVDPNVKAPQALCICPTRELAIQNMEVLQKMGKYTGINAECAVPTERTSSAASIQSRAPVSAQIVIGTPGTIKKWMSIKKLSVNRVKVLVFDEADHMLAEDGFKDDSLRIKKDIERYSPHCQVLLFSATFNEKVTNFVSRVIKGGGNRLFVKKEELSLEAVKQYKVYCPDESMKIEVIKSKIFELGEKIGQRIIFVRTKHSAKKLYDKLVADGYSVTAIQGALNAEQRDKIVKEFRDGLTQVLISTDLLARGFDQQQINCVVNYDLPTKYIPVPRTGDDPVPDYEVYLHRIGRAGRFGRKGAVFNLIGGDWEDLVMSKIEQYFNSQVTEVQNTEEAFEGALKAAGLL